MGLMLAGLLLWYAAHLFKRVLPAQRARLGDKGRGLVALTLLAGVVLMVLGYRRAFGPVWWGANPALVGINNLLVLVAFYLFAADGMKTWAGRRLRHPQLTAFSLWAAAHLLVNGDAPSLVLFGGLLVWALLEIAVINHQQPHWTPRAAIVLPRKEVMAAVGGLVVFIAVGLIHAQLGPNPFGG